MLWWPWLVGGGVAGVGAWLLFGESTDDESKPKSAIGHLVPPADAHLIPLTPQHKPLALRMLKTTGQAVSPAKSLYSALQTGQAPPNLVAAFQKATDADPISRGLVGPVPATGVYDPRTSAALTMYTEDPVPAHPSVPDQAHPTTPASILSTLIPGTAALAGSNLFVYLLGHGKDGTPALANLTRRFQQAVNTDPKFPGPACKNGLPILIPQPLVVDGIPGQKTLKALSVLAPAPLKI